MPLTTELFAFVMDDTGPGDEGVPAFMNGTILMPMIGADMERLQDLTPIAQQLADESGKQIRIYRFSHKEQIGVIEPRRPSLNCVWCHEPLADSERNANTPLLDMHVECGFRSTMGSLAHMQGRCGCYVAGSLEEDPPGMTRREAAKAAADYWRALDDEGQAMSIYRPRVRGRE